MTLLEATIQGIGEMYAECDRIDALGDAVAQKRAMDVLQERIYTMTQKVPQHVRQAAFAALG